MSRRNAPCATSSKSKICNSKLLSSNSHSAPGLMTLGRAVILYMDGNKIRTVGPSCGLMQPYAARAVADVDALLVDAVVVEAVDAVPPSA